MIRARRLVPKAQQEVFVDQQLIYITRKLAKCLFSKHRTTQIFHKIKVAGRKYIRRLN
jgi:hypothetical protein